MTSSSETLIDKQETSNLEAGVSVGAVRGRNVYELTSRRQLVKGLGNSLDNVIQQRFLNLTSAYRRRVYDAELRLVAGGGYELWIPASGTSPAVHVPIHFDAKPAPLSGGVHGAEQGPAQYELTRDATGWQARIEIDESLHRRDVLFTIGHELDEIALIVRANPSDEAAILAEGRASLFKPGANVPLVTAHDRAAARELCAQWQDLVHSPRGTTPTGIKRRQDRVGRMIDAMGLAESAHLFDKLHLLRAEGAPDDLLRRIGAPEELTRYRNSPELRVLQARLPSFKSIIDKELISHLMIPRDPGRSFFLRLGINGGHHDRWLHNFIDIHPQYVIVKEAEKVAGGVIYRKYSQYRWEGSGGIMVLKVNNLSLPLKWTPTGPLLFIEDKFFEPIEWIVNAAVIDEIPQLTESIARGEDVVMEQRFAVRPMPDEELSEARARWHKLTGEEPGEDVYVLGTGFTYHEVVMPRKTLLEIIQALSCQRAEFPEPPFPWLFRLKPYFFSPAEGERELVCELEKRAQVFGRMQKEGAADETTGKKLLDDLQAAGVFSEVYSKQKQEWLERWGAEKLLTYHTDAMKFLNHFRSQVQPPAAQEMVPASVLGASISVGAWKSPWR